MQMAEYRWKIPFYKIKGHGPNLYFLPNPFGEDWEYYFQKKTYIFFNEI